MIVQGCLSKLLLFGKMDFGGERRIAAEMYERTVVAGEILIKEGDTGQRSELHYLTAHMPDTFKALSHQYIGKDKPCHAL